MRCCRPILLPMAPPRVNYYCAFAWNGHGEFSQTGAHQFRLAAPGSDVLEFTIAFAPASIRAARTSRAGTRPRLGAHQERAGCAEATGWGLSSHRDGPVHPAHRPRGDAPNPGQCEGGLGVAEHLGLGLPRAGDVRGTVGRCVWRNRWPVDADAQEHLPAQWPQPANPVIPAAISAWQRRAVIGRRDDGRRLGRWTCATCPRLS